MRTIRVTGRGSLKIKPDLTKITVTLEGTFPTYDETLRRSSADTETVRGLLPGLGLSGGDLKTLDFTVETEYEGCDDNGVYRQRFVGYSYRHEMKVEFLSDPALLGRLLFALANCPVSPEFHIGYAVKNMRSVKNQLLARAVADAAEKANLLAQAAGVTLKDIESIDYSWDQVRFEPLPMHRISAAKMSPLAADESIGLDLQPDDLTAEDTVTVIWEIE